MNTPERPTRGFEERLLAELKREVEAAGAESSRPLAAPPAPPARLGWRRRVVLAGGVAAVLAVALGAGLPLVTGGDGTAAAYAVDAQPDGSVTVEIRALRDAEGLERQLRAAGVPAVVQYLPPGKACRTATFEPARGGGPTRGSMAVSDGTVRFTIDAGSLEPGQTLVIYSQNGGPVAGEDPEQQATTIAIAFAQGEVKPCEVVDAPGGLASPAPLPGAGAGAVTHVETEPAAGGGTHVESEPDAR